MKSLRAELRNFTVHDRIFVAVSAVLILFSLLMLHREMNRDAAGTTPRIGTITFKYKEARRKITSRAVWFNLDNDSPIYNLDTIRTDDEAQAEIKLLDGTTIEMDENSMIVLNFSPENTKIRFSGGSIRTRRSDAENAENTLSIQSDDGVIRTTRGDVALTEEEPGKVQVSLENGDASVTSSKGEEKKLSRDERVSLTKEAISELPPPVKLRSPRDNSIVFTSERSKRLSLSWENEERLHDTRIQLSDSRKFRDVKADYAARGDTSVVNLAVGNHYWRVTALDRDGKRTYSDARRITVLPKKKLKLFTPLQNQEFRYVTSPPLVNFSWSRAEYGGGYILEIADNREFRNSDTLELVTESITRKLERGRYYWRILPSGNTGEYTDRSDVFSFLIQPAETLPPPRPVSPENGSKLDGMIQKQQGVTFVWIPAGDDSNVEFQLSTDRSFRTGTISRVTRTNHLVIRDELRPGNHFWRVRSLRDGGRPGEFSHTLSFRIADRTVLNLYRPAGGKLHTLKEARSGIDFRWDRKESTGSYEIIVSPTPDFSRTSARMIVRKSTVTLDGLEAGRYYWKVRFLGEDGNLLQESATASFSVLDQLAAPVLRLPAPGSTVDMTYRNELSFQWQGDSRSDRYELKLYQVKLLRQKEVLSIRTDRTGYVLTDLTVLDTGTFRWSVHSSAMVGERRMVSETTTGEFVIKLENPDRVELKVPEFIIVEPGSK